MFDDLVKQGREKGDFPSFLFFFQRLPALLCWQMGSFREGGLVIYAGILGAHMSGVKLPLVVAPAVHVSALDNSPACLTGSARRMVMIRGKSNLV